MTLYDRLMQAAETADLELTEVYGRPFTVPETANLSGAAWLLANFPELARGWLEVLEGEGLTQVNQ